MYDHVDATKILSIGLSLSSHILLSLTYCRSRSGLPNSCLWTLPSLWLPLFLPPTSFYSLPLPIGAVGEAVGEADGETDGEADRTEALSVTTTGPSPGNRRFTLLQKLELLQQK